MSGFESPLVVELAGDLWVLERPLLWVGSDGDPLHVGAGEETDFASVPRLLQWLLPSADPRVVKAAAVHDFLCRQRNRYYAQMRLYRDPIHRERSRRLGIELPRPIEPQFSAVDADAIFRKIMKDEGAGWFMQQVGWVGVRWGALANPARREGWLRTAPAVLGLSALFLAPLVALLALVLA